MISRIINTLKIMNYSERTMLNSQDFSTANFCDAQHDKL